MTPIAKDKLHDEETVSIIFKKLKKAYPDAKIELNFKNALELLVATVLSAQCTDVRVNEVTKELFKTFKCPSDYLKGSVTTLENQIKSTGFFRQKAKSIRGAMRAIIDNHDGKVPASMDALVKLPGVGRKTANVILGNAFNIPGLPVDTHVIRLSNRLGLSNNTDPVKIEEDLCKLIPKRYWTLFSHILIFHGRYCCKARNPNCLCCSVREYCRFYTQQNIK